MTMYDESQSQPKQLLKLLTFHYTEGKTSIGTTEEVGNSHRVKFSQMNRGKDVIGLLKPTRINGSIVLYHTSAKRVWTEIEKIRWCVTKS